MTSFDRDDLPPELSHVERLLRNARPVADDDSLDRMRPHTKPTPSTPGRTPRRTIAVSLATVFSMVALTGGAAAAMFGGVPLVHKSSKTAPAAMSAKSLVSASSSKAAAPTAALGKLPGAGSLKPATPSTTVVKKTLGGTQGALALQSPGSALATLIPSLFPNAGNFQYLLKRLVCRILRRLGLNGFANLLGCPP
jgi:hypothetical protein